MPRPCRHHLRLLTWLGLAVFSTQVLLAAKDDDDTDTPKKSKKSAAKTVEKSSEDAPKKKKRSEPEPEKEAPKSKKDPAKPATKDTGKTADKTPEKETAKGSSKSSGKTASKTAEKAPDKTADKPAEKTVSKSSRKGAPEKSTMTIPVSKKGDDATLKTAPKDTKDVTDQKADRPRDEKAMHDGEDGEFANEGKSKTDSVKPKADDKSANDKDAAKSATTTSSRDMQGWEVVHYQDRDYVTSNSLFRFYRFADHHVEGNVVMFTSSVLVMKAVIGSQELLINNIKFILSNPVEEVNGKVLFSRLDLCKLIDPVLRPSYIGHGQPFDTVIVDAGHGGYDSGARGLYGYEKNFTLQLAALLKADLERRGLKVLLTRSDDTFISLGGRVEFANKVPNSIFVSLHFNSGQSAATGIETYALSPQGTSSDYGARSVDAMAFNGNQRDSENIALATAIHASVVHHFKLVDRGVKRARWYVLTGLERPGVLFEGGFVTNGGDGQLIAAENFRRELAHTIGDAISNYRRALQPQGR